MCGTLRGSLFRGKERSAADNLARMLLVTRRRCVVAAGEVARTAEDIAPVENRQSDDTWPAGRQTVVDNTTKRSEF